MSKNITVVIPFCEKDCDLTIKLLTHIKAISKPIPNACLLMADAMIPHAKKMEVQKLAKEIFPFVEMALVTVPIAMRTWPLAPNYMFMMAGKQIHECYKTPWLWLEPDSVPMTSNWLYRLQIEYNEQPKRFMGSFIKNGGADPNAPMVTLSGVAVYPHDAIIALKPFCEGKAAFDMASAQYVLPRAYNSNLIHHHYGTMDKPPVFKLAREDGDAENVVTPVFVRQDAVLFHRCKDGSLIDCLKPQPKAESQLPAMIKQTESVPKLSPKQTTIPPIDVKPKDMDITNKPKATTVKA